MGKAPYVEHERGAPMSRTTWLRLTNAARAMILATFTLPNFSLATLEKGMAYKWAPLTSET